MVRIVPNDSGYNDFKSATARAEIDKNLQIINTGIAHWNAYFATLRKPAKLATIELANYELIGGHFRNADLRCANLTGANLAGADLSGADLRGARLETASLYKANLQDANMLEARLKGARLDEANVRDANLLDVNLSGAVLRSADLHGAFLFRTNLGNADLDGASGIVLDGTYIAGARLPVANADLWSALRRSFTGSAMVFNLLLVAVFLLPLVKAAFWLGVNELQVASTGMVSKVGLTPCLAVACVKQPIWQIVLGIGQAPMYWIATAALLIYNAIRLVLTVVIAPLRDEEQRSGFSPRFWPTHESPYGTVDPLPTDTRRHRFRIVFGRLAQSYGWMRWPYRLMRTLFWLAIALFMWHLWTWMHVGIYLPRR